MLRHRIIIQSIRIRQYLLLTAFTGWALSAFGEVYQYPVDVGVIDVTQAPWNVDNTGSTDVTETLQTLIDETIPRKFPISPEGYWPFILYFPNGTYLLSDSLVGAILNNGTALGGLIIQGESRDGVILKLVDNAVGFDDPLSPKILLDYFAGDWTNNAFVNGLENVTLDIGVGNPGATGLHFHANNMGAVRHVTIRSSDPEKVGHIGLQSQKGTVGPYFIKDLKIEGFDIGISIGDLSVGRHGVTIDGLELEGQRQFGIQQQNVIVNIKDGVSHNSVPLVKGLDGNALLNVVGMDLQVPDPNAFVGALIQTEGSAVSLRNITASSAVDLVSDGSEVILSQLDSGARWHSAERNALWPETDDQSLGLPIEETPVFEWLDASDWAIVDGALQGDDTEAIREAFRSGKPMVIFKPGGYSISDTIHIPSHIQRIAGQYATLNMQGGFNGSGAPVFSLAESDHEMVLIERFKGRFNKTSDPNPFILNASRADLVLRDLFWVSGPVYRSEPTGSHVFVENVHSLPGSQSNYLSIPAYEIRGQSMWAQQFNPEQLFPHAQVDAGQFWLFGSKVGETRGPIVQAEKHSAVEVFGISLNVTHDTLDIEPENTVILVIDESNVSANFIEMATLSGGGRGWGRHHTVVQETRNGEMRTLLNTDPSVVHRSGFLAEYGANMGLYTGFFSQDNPGNAAPIVTGLEAISSKDGYSYTLSGTAFDPDAFPASPVQVLWRRTDGPGMTRFSAVAGESVTASFDRAGTYTLEAIASDGALKSSKSFSLRVVPRSFRQIFGRNDVHRYVDNAPQDGISDLFQIAFLRVGDDGSNNRGDLKVEFSLRPFMDSDERIDSAEVRFQIQDIVQLEGLSTSYHFANSLGIADAEDFEAIRIPLSASVDLSNLQAGDWLTINIESAIEAALVAGADFLTIWLEPQTTQQGVAEYIQFTSTVSAEETRPYLDVRFLPPTMQDEAIQIADGSEWYQHPVFGFFYHAGPWQYSVDLGWIYTDIPGNAATSFFAYSDQLGWIYLSDRYYPWHYVYETSTWARVNRNV